MALKNEINAINHFENLKYFEISWLGEFYSYMSYIYFKKAQTFIKMNKILLVPEIIN